MLVCVVFLKVLSKRKSAKKGARKYGLMVTLVKHEKSVGINGTGKSKPPWSRELLEQSK